MPEDTRTALGSAQERFVLGLPERGRELRELCRALEIAPQDSRVLEQLRRRIQTLYASAQVFQDQALLERLQNAIAALDAARDAERALDQAERASLLGLCAALSPDDNAGPPQPPDSERVAAMFSKERWSGVPLLEALPQAAAQPDPAVGLTQSVAGALPTPDVIAVLVLAGAEAEQSVRAALPVEQCELTSTSEPETALLVIDQVAPDVVLVEAALLARGGEDLARGLRGERAAPPRALVALLPERVSEVDAQLTRSLADAALRLPLPPGGLLERLLRLSGRGLRAAAGLDALDAGTVDEIARGVAEEVRRGIADSLRQGRGERIELADKSELMAATWSAVARIRAHLMQRAQGRLRFDEAPYAGGPAALALTADAPLGPQPGIAESLEGRRILLVDDDPAVVWFFAGLLREAGAIAVEADNGREALELARQRPPDLLISDILMPGIDGFTLCRELRGDLALCHVPVILLSWKEDFLQRMRELDAGASGYLRKEAGSLQILTTVAEALRPRAELAALLRSGEEVQGRVEDLGVQGLLQCVAAVLPDARVALRDAWNLFEIDVRGGANLALTRTASDGSFARGAGALRQLLGVEVGRYTVARADGPLRGAFPEPLDRLLSHGIERLGALLDAVSDSRLMQVSRVGFDDEILGSLISATPTPLADVAARLRAGEGARALVLSGAYSARELEQYLRELARRGAVVEVLGPEGEDLVEAARLAREQHPGSLLHAAQRPARASLPPTELTEADVEWVRPRRDLLMPELAASASAEADALAAQAVPAPPPARSVPQPSPPPADPEPGAAPPPPPPQAFNVRSARLDPGGAPARSSTPSPPRGSRALGALTLLGLAAVAYFGVRLAQPSLSLAGAHVVLPRPSVPEATPVPAGVRDAPPAEPAQTARAQPAAPAPEQGLPVARALPFVDQSRGVEVAEDQGLLVVEDDRPGGVPPKVRVDGRELGPATVATALAGGRHEIVLKSGDQTSFRYVVIRPGETRIVEIRE